MGFVSVLGKILKDVVTGIGIFEGIEPELYQSVPKSAQEPIQTVTDDLTEIGSAVTSAAAAVGAIKPGATAADIATAAQPAISSILVESELLAGKKPADEAAFNDGVGQLSQAVTAILNSLEAKK